uniref:Uncharacterized protein n=1 Tax=Aegilops tauschii subsp. strangulata TaxID=200361 RepID=A0A453L4N3_AEGTS
MQRQHRLERAIPQVQPMAAAHHQLRPPLGVGVRQRPILRYRLKLSIFLSEPCPLECYPTTY